MSKVLIDAERLDLLVAIVLTSGKSILKNGVIQECCYTSCDSCVFCELSCRFGSKCYEDIYDWVKGD